MTKSQKLRKRMGDPYPSGPPGDGLLPSPKDCLRSRRTGRKCDLCGTMPVISHLLLRRAGVFCPRCCPICTAPVEPTAALGATTPLPDARGAAQASAGARGGAFNRKPWGREYSKYLEG